MTPGRRPEVVGDDRHQLAAHAIGLDRSCSAASRSRARMPRSGVLGPLAIGEVAGDLGVAPVLAVGRHQRGDDDVGPEPGAVAPHPPALGLPAPLAPWPSARPCVGHAGPPVLLGVEGRDGPADDLVGPVALEPLGADVPAGHPAVGVEQEDGVVGDAGDEQAEPLLALHAGRPRCACRSDESRATEPEPEQPLVLAPQGGERRRWPRTGLPSSPDPPPLGVVVAVGARRRPGPGRGRRPRCRRRGRGGRCGGRGSRRAR